MTIVLAGLTVRHRRRELEQLTVERMGSKISKPFASISDGIDIVGSRGVTVQSWTVLYCVADKIFRPSLWRLLRSPITTAQVKVE